MTLRSGRRKPGDRTFFSFRTHGSPQAADRQKFTDEGAGPEQGTTQQRTRPPEEGTLTVPLPRLSPQCWAPQLASQTLPNLTCRPAFLT